MKWIVTGWVSVALFTIALAVPISVFTILAMNVIFGLGIPITIKSIVSMFWLLIVLALYTKQK